MAPGQPAYPAPERPHRRPLPWGGRKAAAAVRRLCPPLRRRLGFGALRRGRGPAGAAARLSFGFPAPPPPGGAGALPFAGRPAMRPHPLAGGKAGDSGDGVSLPEVAGGGQSFSAAGGMQCSGPGPAAGPGGSLPPDGRGIPAGIPPGDGHFGKKAGSQRAGDGPAGPGAGSERRRPRGGIPLPAAFGKPGKEKALRTVSCPDAPAAPGPGPGSGLLYPFPLAAAPCAVSPSRRREISVRPGRSEMPAAPAAPQAGLLRRDPGGEPDPGGLRRAAHGAGGCRRGGGKAGDLPPGQPGRREQPALRPPGGPEGEPQQPRPLRRGDPCRRGKGDPAAERGLRRGLLPSDPGAELQPTGPTVAAQGAEAGRRHGANRPAPGRG